MLKLVVHPDRPNRWISVRAGDGDGDDPLWLCAVQTPDPDGRRLSRACWNTLLISDGGEDRTNAASLLHALELGIAAAARWIAVELLKDPASPKKLVGGIALCFDPDPDIHDNRHFVLCGRHVATLGHLFSTDTYAMATPKVGRAPFYPERWEYATEEQALAALIEHAAPWIAVALEKELKP